jgi:AcrR family transcriptional regulator
VSPRARNSDVDIFGATLDVIAEHGVSRATVDMVAARAGMSKATIYRHWGSRAQLIHAALSSLEGPYVETPGNSLREDLAILLSHLVAYFDRPEILRIFPSFIDAAVRDPELAELHMERMRGARAGFEEVVHRAIERGELSADVDVGLLVDVVRAPFIYRPVIARAPVALEDIDTVLDLVLGALIPVQN